MIQEIYDYLLIRHILITNTREELLEDINNKEMYDKTVKVVANLMETEDFVLVVPGVQEKVDEMIKNYRFDYCDKNNVEEINYIVDMLNKYKNKSDGEIERRRIDFLLDEFKDRNLSMKYTFKKEKILDMIANDFVVYESFSRIPALEEENAPFEIKVEIDYFTSTVNLLMSRFPDLFKEVNIAPYLRHILTKIKECKQVNIFSKSYIKRTLKDLDYVEEQNKEKRLDY